MNMGRTALRQSLARHFALFGAGTERGNIASSGAKMLTTRPQLGKKLRITAGGLMLTLHL